MTGGICPFSVSKRTQLVATRARSRATVDSLDPLWYEILITEPYLFNWPSSLAKDNQKLCLYRMFRAGCGFVCYLYT